MASSEEVDKQNFNETDEPSKCFGSAFQTMREKSEFTDVVLVCNGGEVAAHQMVLAARSEYFRKMFLSKFKESITKEVQFSDINKDIIHLIVDYIYLNSMENISDQNVESLIKIYQVSHLFEISDLTKSCWKLILNRISVYNWFNIWELVLLHGNDEEILEILNFILKNLSEIVERNFSNLDYQQLMRLLEKINENNLPMEEKFLDAIIQWNKNTKQENKNFQQIILNINFDFISREFMNIILEKESDLFEDTFFSLFKRLFLPKLKTSSEIQSLKKAILPKLAKTLMSSQKLLFFECYRSEINQCFLYKNARLRIFDCEKQSVCKTINNLPFRFGHGIFPIQYGSDIYIVGGTPNGTAEPAVSNKTKSFFLYDWKNHQVVVKPSLIEEVSDPLTCICENKIYVIDYDTVLQQTVIQYFSLSEQKWFLGRYTLLLPVACSSINNTVYLLCIHSNVPNYYNLYRVNQLDCPFYSNTPVPYVSKNPPAHVNHIVYEDKLFLLSDEHKNSWYTFDPNNKLWNTTSTSVLLKSFSPGALQCFANGDISIMFYNKVDHSLYQFDENNCDIKKIMTVRGLLENDKTFDDVNYSRY